MKRQNSLISLVILSFTGIVLVSPAQAQYTTVSAAPLDQFADNHGQYASSYEGNTGTQTLQFLDSMAPKLQGATHGTIGPQGADATYITGVNTAGTVRVNNLANLEAL